MQKLDEYQQNILKTNDNIRVIAGAGSGKTFTLLSKVYDLIENEHVTPTQILMISFTNASVDDIKRKIKYNIEVLTFHKLAIKILDNSKLNYKLASESTLTYIINEYLINASKEEQHAILKYIQYTQKYCHFIKSNQFIYFKRFVSAFINQYQSNNYSTTTIKTIHYSKREIPIVTIIFKIFLLYIIEKNSNISLDLNDLIVYAKNNIDNINFNYKYIIIDEFQDTSYSRFDLVKTLSQKCSSKLIVVGDDWQSIYKFTGCNLNIFLNLEQYVSNLTTITLSKNYRNSNMLLQIAKFFIEKNSFQIKKELHSDINIKDPIIFIPYTHKINALKYILSNLIESNIDDIMILSRNNNDIYGYIDKTFKIENDSILYNNHFFKYLTIHRSKGLESNVVILLNCNDNLMGFPNKLEDNSIMKKTFTTGEPIYSEERRLMYVALTRTKSNIYILYDKNSPSIFISELKKLKKKVSKKLS